MIVANKMYCNAIADLERVKDLTLSKAERSWRERWPTCRKSAFDTINFLFQTDKYQDAKSKMDEEFLELYP